MGNKKVGFIEVLWHHDVLSSIYQLSQYFLEWEPVIITTRGLCEKARLSCGNVKIIKLKNPYRHYWASLKYWKKIVYLPKLFLEMKKDGENLDNNCTELPIFI